MHIKGLQKTTLLDFPGKVACTVFTGGCNFRCPFCHNASLVLRPNDTDEMGVEEFFAFLEKRRGILDGVCVTGGEPLLQKDIIPFLERIHSMDFAIKVDTNGSYPQILSEIIDKGLVDHIAMDIKNTPHKYALTAGTKTLPDGVPESIHIIMNSGVSYEFRTTVVKGLHDEKDIEEIAELIHGAEKYFLQLYKDSGDLIDNSYSAHDEDTMKRMLELVRPHVKICGLRGM